jgi:hypothetical protein
MPCHLAHAAALLQLASAGELDEMTDEALVRFEEACRHWCVLASQRRNRRAHEGRTAADIAAAAQSRTEGVIARLNEGERAS